MDAVGNPGQRLDRWLCNSRNFKTRALAADAINNGRVEVNGVRAKAAKLVKPGDLLHIRRPPQVHEITVLGLSPRRVSAALAQALYRESPASIAARQRLSDILALGASGADHGVGKPDKKARRERERFKRAHD